MEMLWKLSHRQPGDRVVISSMVILFALATRLIEAQVGHHDEQPVALRPVHVSPS